MSHRGIRITLCLALFGLLGAAGGALHAEEPAACEACVKKAVQQALSDIRSRGWLGMALHYHRAPDGSIAQGAEVISIDPESPAARSVLEEGDVLLRWNETSLEKDVKDEIQNLTKALHPGDRVHLLVQRKDQRLDVELAAAPIPPDALMKALGAQMLIDYGGSGQPGG